MKAKIKDYFIHLLGGKTMTEYQSAKHKKFSEGYNYAREEVRNVMKDLYGHSAEEMCDSIWKFVVSK